LAEGAGAATSGNQIADGVSENDPDTPLARRVEALEYLV
jgi:hypothetical protein